MEVVNKSIIKKVFPEKKEFSHKGEYGRLLSICGSKWFCGSGVFIGLSAAYCGADLVFFIGPERAMEKISIYPFFITNPLKGDWLKLKHFKEIKSFCKIIKPTCVSIGSGLWRKKETLKCILKLVNYFNLPLVLDADSIRALALNKKVLEKKKCIITPHIKEFEILTGRKIDKYDFKKVVSLVKEEAERLNEFSESVLILKGKYDIISDGRRVAINKTGNPYMSVGGTGDSLVGICLALIGRRVDEVSLFDAAKAAAYINGKAGDITLKYKKYFTVLDLIKNIPRVLKNG